MGAGGAPLLKCSAVGGWLALSRKHWSTNGDGREYTYPAKRCLAQHIHDIIKAIH